VSPGARKRLLAGSQELDGLDLPPPGGGVWYALRKALHHDGVGRDQKKLGIGRGENITALFNIQNERRLLKTSVENGPRTTSRNLLPTFRILKFLVGRLCKVFLKKKMRFIKEGNVLLLALKESR